jgi:hypothetical protein
MHLTISKSLKQLPNVTEVSRNKCLSNNFQWYSLSNQCLYCYHFLPFAQHESGTRKVSLGPWPNNTAVNLMSLLVLKNTQLQLLYTTLCDKVCQWLAAGRWFSLSNLVSSTNKTEPHYITEILLKVALNTITHNLKTLHMQE